MKPTLFVFAAFVSLSLLGSIGCTQQAEPMCQSGEEICNAEGSASFACADGSWKIKQACTGRSESCRIAGGEAGCFCEDGVVDCSDDGRMVQVCAAGQWSESEVCGETDVCNYDGEADAVSCMPADLACDPTRERERCRVLATAGDPDAKYTADAYECGANGQWSLKTRCQEAEVCIMKMASAEATKADPLLREVAACEPFPCQEGMEYCPAGSATGNPHVCEDGKLVKKDTCGEDTACVINPGGTAVCVDWWHCDPGEEWCGMDGRAYRCGQDQQHELKEDCSGDVACMMNGGVASCMPTCNPGEQQCSSGEVAQVCGADRMWTDAMVCAENEECVVNAGAATCRATAL